MGFTSLNVKRLKVETNNPDVSQLKNQKPKNMVCLSQQLTASLCTVSFQRFNCSKRLRTALASGMMHGQGESPFVFFADFCCSRFSEPSMAVQ